MFFVVSEYPVRPKKMTFGSKYRINNLLNVFYLYGWGTNKNFMLRICVNKNGTEVFEKYISEYVYGDFSRDVTSKYYLLDNDKIKFLLDFKHEIVRVYIVREFIVKEFEDILIFEEAKIFSKMFCKGDIKSVVGGVGVAGVDKFKVSLV